MQPNASSVPKPIEPQTQPVPAPGPSIVPPKEHRPRRRRSLWITVIALVIAGGGLAYYLNMRNEAKLAAKGAVFTVSTAIVGLSDLHATVRVTGTVTVAPSPGGSTARSPIVKAAPSLLPLTV